MMNRVDSLYAHTNSGKQKVNLVVFGWAWSNMGMAFQVTRPYNHYLKDEMMNRAGFLHASSDAIIFGEIAILTNAQKMKFSITDFFSKCDQIRSFLRIWLHLLKKSAMENFIFCAMTLYL